MTHHPSPRAFIPHLVVRDASAAAEWYVRVLGAIEDYRLSDPQGRIHAELELEDARFMLADEYPELGLLGPLTRGGWTSSLSLYVADVDSFAARILAAGGELERPISDEFYGDRVARFRDPFGHLWSFHTRREQLSPKIMQERLTAMCTGQP